MSVPPIVKATLQAAVINAGSNVLAQSIKAYRSDVSGFFFHIHFGSFLACLPLGKILSRQIHR